MAEPAAAELADAAGQGGGEAEQPPQMSKSARKRLLKQQKQERQKAERKSAEKERRRLDLERRRREWDERLAGVGEEERERLLEERREARQERMGVKAAERAEKAARLRSAAEGGQKVVIDLEFADLMAANEIRSLLHQLMLCYAVNGKCAAPAHLMLTGCRGEIQNQLQRLPGYERWILEKEHKSYVDVYEDQKEKLVYLTADSDVELDNLDLEKIYIIGGLVDRNRWKGVTLKKAQEQGIKTAKLPISAYLKLSSSQVLTVNQVFEILLKFIETNDWKDAFFKVIPQRKRSENVADHDEELIGNGADNGHDSGGNLADAEEEENIMTRDEEVEEEEREAKKTKLENGH